MCCHLLSFIKQLHNDYAPNYTRCYPPCVHRAQRGIIYRSKTTSSEETYPMYSVLEPPNMLCNIPLPNAGSDDVFSDVLLSCTVTEHTTSCFILSTVWVRIGSSPSTGAGRVVISGSCVGASSTSTFGCIPCGKHCGVCRVFMRSLSVQLLVHLVCLY